MLTHGGVNRSATLEAQAGSGGPFGVFSRGSAPSPFAFPPFAFLFAPHPQESGGFCTNRLTKALGLREVVHSVGNPL